MTNHKYGLEARMVAEGIGASSMCAKGAHEDCQIYCSSASCACLCHPPAEFRVRMLHDAAFRQGYDTATAHVVAWLNKESQVCECHVICECGSFALDPAASAIERGEHVPTT